MKITSEQLSILNSLIVERLNDNTKENKELVKTFVNRKNKTLAQIINSNSAFERDNRGEIAYYIVKTSSGILLTYFSLKCGELFHELDMTKMLFAKKAKEALAILTNSSSFSKDLIQAAEKFIKENYKAIQDILPNLDDYKTKKTNYLADLERELKEKVRHVHKTYPAIEIVEFCANDQSREAWKSLGLKRKMGECVFWHIIVPKLKAIQQLVGCQYVYLFAADSSIDGNLVNYYKVAMHFENSIVLGANKSQYDFSCVFLHQKMIDIFKQQTFFYEHFNPDKELNDII